jgi:hypothetical protein
MRAFIAALALLVAAPAQAATLVYDVNFSGIVTATDTTGGNLTDGSNAMDLDPGFVGTALGHFDAIRLGDTFTGRITIWLEYVLESAPHIGFYRVTCGSDLFSHIQVDLCGEPDALRRVPIAPLIDGDHMSLWVFGQTINTTIDISASGGKVRWQDDFGPRTYKTQDGESWQSQHFLFEADVRVTENLLAPVPLPSSALLLAGALGLGWRRFSRPTPR